MRNCKAFLLFTILLGTIVAGCKLLSNTAEGQRDPPNIVLIVADDLGYDYLGCYREGMVQTPNLDQLAGAGIRFTNFYSNSSVCSPSRAALLTGKYQQRAGVDRVVKGAIPGMYPGALTLAELLKKQKYATGIFGKWHLGEDPQEHPLAQGFDNFYGVLTGHVDYISHRTANGKADLWQNKTAIQREGHLTNLITDEAIAFMDKQQGPFFTYLPYMAPHSPYLLEGDQAIFTETRPRNRRSDKKWNTLSNYKAMVELLDLNIGRIITHLSETDQLKNTIICFVSDGGAPKDINEKVVTINRGDKGVLLEGGIRVPAIMFWADSLGPHTFDKPLMGLDLVPSLLDLAGIEYETGQFEGISMKRFFGMDQMEETDRQLFWKLSRFSAIRENEWKGILIETDTSLAMELNESRMQTYFEESFAVINFDVVMREKELFLLYNLAEDPMERLDQSRLYPEKSQALRDALVKWKSSLPDLN